MSKFGDLIAEARKEEIKDKPENQKTKRPKLDLSPVNLSIKVPKAYRQHWAVEAKRSGSTLTAVITEALEEKFGKPE